MAARRAADTPGASRPGPGRIQRARPIKKASVSAGLLCAQGGIRTRTPFGATPSRWCVYQFHHLGFFRCELRGSYTTERAPDFNCNLAVLLPRLRLLPAGGRRLLLGGAAGGTGLDGLGGRLAGGVGRGLLQSDAGGAAL